MESYQPPEHEQVPFMGQQQHYSVPQSEQPIGLQYMAPQQQDHTSKHEYNQYTSTNAVSDIEAARQDGSDVEAEESKVSLYYEKRLLISLKTWRHHGTRAWIFFTYRTNSCKYNDTSIYRHRDLASRVEQLPLQDAHLSPWSGKLVKSIIQCTDDVYEAPGQSTWSRTYVRNASPFYVRLAIWTVDYAHGTDDWKDWLYQVMRTIPTGLAMMSVCIGGLDKSVLHGGRYSPVLYKYWGDAKVWSNLLENSRELSRLARNTWVYRSLKPRTLCLLNDVGSEEMKGWETIDVAQWESEPENSARSLSYVFVAWCSEHFCNDPGDGATPDEEYVRDMTDLHYIAELAARRAGVASFWISASCMPNLNDEEMEREVFRISDILRGAQSMVIVVGPSRYNTAAGTGLENKVPQDPLHQLGSRLWTFPEVLLSPNQPILVYTRGGDLDQPLVLPKNQIAPRLWPEDADISRQLLDHYLGTINLSRLELAVLALKCLNRRQTTEYLEGDHAYALMGLLRLRPEIDHTDSSFQAFARLSLANDSDKLLERYICTLPLEPSQPWWDMTDAYGSSLWDIDPTCQVAAICDDDTVVLDGARGATIDWTNFDPVWYKTGSSWKRWISISLIRYSWVALIAGVVLIALNRLPYTCFEAKNPEFLKNGDNTCNGVSLSSDNCISAYQQDGICCAVKATCHSTSKSLIAAGGTLLGIWLAVVLITPVLVRTVLGGKIKDIQAAFYGVEGYLNPETVERLIFGGNFRRMKWSTNGSVLSRSSIDKNKEIIGIDPCVDKETKRKVEAAKAAQLGSMRIFTLVDTYNMQVTIFEAARPPNVLLFCGSEGGMQRVVGCSYDWTKQAFYRETVLRVPSESLGKASRVSRFRMGIQRPTLDTVYVGSRNDEYIKWGTMFDSLFQFFKNLSKVRRRQAG